MHGSGPGARKRGARPALAMIMPAFLIAIAFSVSGVTKADTLHHPAAPVSWRSPKAGPISYGGPITISSGGTYSGNWESTNPSTPAVTITTTQPVVIDNSHITGVGDLIYATSYSGADVTIKDTYGYGLNPEVAGDAPGSFFKTNSWTHVDVENNWIEGVLYGVYLHDYVGGSTPTYPAEIRSNIGFNLESRQSNGEGGWKPPAYTETGHFVLFNNGSGNTIPGADISWNQVIQDPYAGRTEDIIDMFQAAATAADPIKIHDNFLDGGYSDDPRTDLGSEGGITVDWSSTDTASNASQYIDISDNQVIANGNKGITIVAGHNNTASGNTVISSGLLPDGSIDYGLNVGLDCYDLGDIAKGIMYSNSMTGNTVGYMRQGGFYAPGRSDYYFPNQTTGCANDASLNTSLATNPTLATEYAQYPVWLQKLANNHISVGPPSTAAYPDAVTADNPVLYWRLDDTSGSVAADSSGNNNTGIYQGSPTLNQPGAVRTDRDSAVVLNGSSQYVTSSPSFDNPQVFTEEIWFKTISRSGGMLAGFGSSQTGASAMYDRDIYMDDSGHLVFTTYNQSSAILYLLASPDSYNDGAWHMVTATLGPSGMDLYVDGALVASRSGWTVAQDYTGYWRVGYDSLLNRPDQPTSSYFNGSVDEFAVYNQALTATQISDQFSTNS